MPKLFALALISGSMIVVNGQPEVQSQKITKNSIQKEVDLALQTLRQKEGASVELKKKTSNSLLGREKSSEGQLFYRQGKLRLEIKSPENSLLVLDGKNLWLATTLSSELGGKVMVSKTNARNLKKSNTLIAALLENKSLLHDFKTAKRKTDGDQVHLILTPKDQDNEIQELQLWLNPKAGRLLKVQFLDDKENQTSFELSAPETLSGNSKKLFSYQPPQDAEVTEF